MARDLFHSPYGRFYYLANYLSGLGHNVNLVLISYSKEERQYKKKDNLTIQSISLVPNPIKAMIDLSRIIRTINPDWICGFSDIYFGILAWYFSRTINKKFLIDAYDNYEAYLPFAKPLHWLWRQSLKNADAVTCTGPGLAELFRQRGRSGTVDILPMTVDPIGFTPLPRNKCREMLGLPVEKKIIGYHGSISHTRDINVLFKAMDILIDSHPGIILLLAGRLFKNIKVPEFANYLGYLSDDDMPVFVNSLNVLAVTNRDSRFGHYSHPIKIYEAMACHIPVVATKTITTEWILKDHAQQLVVPGDPEDMAKKISDSLTLDRVEYDQLPDWQVRAKQFENILQRY